MPWAARWVVEFVRVLRILPRVEWGRRAMGPMPLVDELRRRGRHCRARDPQEREMLRRAIGTVDAVMPSGANCYRRALLEIALDPASAAEPLHLGLAAHGGPKSGHAWIGQQPVDVARYEVRIDM